MGHIRDLPASAAEIPKELKGKSWARLGIKLNEDFEPLYIVSPKKKSVVSKLKSALRDADELYIATDEDREGESIGWHLLEVLKPKIPVKRMVFHEITAEAIHEALKHTRDIDKNLVDAQETRRVLDRLVGYTISPLLWKKIAPRLSAGRVQSVAVRLMVLREKDRIAFVPASYWDLKAQLDKDKRGFEAVMTHLGGIRLATGRDFDAETGKLKANLSAGKDVLLLTEAKAQRLAEQSYKNSWQVSNVEERLGKRSPAAPFTTSTLQQEASRKLNLSAKRTMQIAQGLYENGYITYMRTDSTHLSKEAIDASRRAVAARYGQEYLSPNPRQYRTKSRSAQEAHEAIRPAGKAMKTREDHGLSGIEGALYDLIWKRTVATQMADARLRFVSAIIDIAAGENNEIASFRATGRNTIFPGFFRAYVEGSDDPDAALENQEQPLPDLKPGDILNCHEVNAAGHETKPPARFTEASLVKLLEQEGIGRPSTYASIIDTVIKRGYVRKQGNQLMPTFTAFATNNLLEKQFERLVDTQFTAGMEQVLDDIANGEKDAIPYLHQFYFGETGLETRVEEGLEEIDARAVSTIQFPQWGDAVVRVGRFGPYVEGEIDGKKVTASLPENLAPGDVSEETLTQLLQLGKPEDNSLGNFPGSEQAMLLRRGPYGPYLQLGNDEQKGKPKRVSLPKNISPGELNPEIAAALLSLPRTLGVHPETHQEIQAHIGRFGSYVKHGSTFASLGKDDDVLTVTLTRALELIAKKEVKNKPLRVLGTHPESGESVEIREGRYGPYVKHQKTNASLLKGQNPDTISLAEALSLLAEKSTSRTVNRGKVSTKKTKTSKKRPKTKIAKKSPPKPKATLKELETLLPGLDQETATVVAKVEGMRGESAQNVAAVARELKLSTEDVKAIHKRGMFKLRMAFGRARKNNNQAEAA